MSCVPGYSGLEYLADRRDGDSAKRAWRQANAERQERERQQRLHQTRSARPFRLLRQPHSEVAQMLPKEQAQTLASSLSEKWSKPVAIGGGYTARAKLEYDNDTRLEDDGD